ncbi:hypothetical protein KC571_02260 [candidate division WWE3 bacterium]|uniref:Prepilin-type N-terminal cleavage/methylation domain-containing protein n=1 Tax=candidate division WWE3 bacterium TaxID=2053526 RepID=A0A955LGV3_UNCKA|nr:hypothetical protein [candidate division WWE3 bacterium]
MKKRLPVFLNNKSGISLVEILLSVGILLVIGTVIINVGSSTLLSSNTNRNRTRALYYTQQAIEQVRLIRDANSQDIFTMYGYYNLDSSVPQLVAVTITHPPANPVSTAFLIDPDGFYRMIEINDYNVSDPTRKIIMVTTAYRDKNDYKTVTASTYLTDWQQ